MTPEDNDKLSLTLLLEYSANLPTSPRIFSRLDKLIQDEDVALDYIASLLKTDPGLSAHILRVTNSAFYGAAVKVTSMEAAISRIGFQELRNILGQIVEHDSFFQALPCYGISATEFSNQSLNVAIAAETLAKRTGTDSDIAYITGLLHAIGKLSIDLYLHKREREFDIPQKAGGMEITQFELARFGISHYRAGAELLKHWQYDGAIWQAIKNLAWPQHAVAFKAPTATLVVAIWIPAQLNGYNSDEPLPTSLKWALNELRISALDLPSIIDECRFEINDRHNQLSMLL
ncbi:HDOD domain-containing protein [Puniceicoccaceae bacterium K14]|nr:HDOD domain-containing protein [Puniceicoccaceae bacterium K14]